MTIRTLAAAATLLAAAVASQAATIDFTYNFNGEESKIWGTEKRETYDVGIRLDHPALIGAKVTGLTVDAYTNPSLISNVTAWVATELTKNFEPTMSVDATHANGKITATFAQPYEIPAGGLYVGYSLTVDTITGDSKYPLAVVPGAADGGLWIHSSRTYRNWMDISPQLGAVSAMRVTIEGNIPTAGASVTLPETVYAKAGAPSTFTATLTNGGTSAISSIGYSYSINGTLAGQATAELSPAIPAALGAPGKAEFTLEPIAEKGIHELSLTITAVNGTPLAAPSAATGSVAVAGFAAVNRPLVEDYTGTWCGFCSLAAAMMDHMSATHPGRFVGLAFHDRDPMATTAMPSYVTGFPTLFVNQNRTVTLGADQIPDVWADAAAQPIGVDLNVDLAWADDDHNKLTATANVVFATDEATPGYGVSFVLVADSLRGEGSEWLQSNYYAGGAYGSNNPSFPAWGQYLASKPKKFAMTFNDVVLAHEGHYSGGKTLAGPFKAEEPTSISHTFDLTAVKSGLIGPRSHVRVVAVVFKNGTVVNSNTSAYAAEPMVAIREVVGKPAAPVSYFDLQGRPVASPSRGLFIGSDGSKRRF